MKLKRALVSVSDKTGIVPFCQFLHSKGVELVSTGGTAKILSENKIPFIPIEKITGNPEAFGGRMKTISFQVGSALLFRRDHEEDLIQAAKFGIEAIDLVVCNLYPFEKTAREGRPLQELIENIDIGGPTMVRAAAKNFQYVSCITSPDSYSEVQDELATTNQISLITREKLALQAFTRIAEYDLSIAMELSHRLESGKKLRYGENPHQRATLIPINNTSQQQTLANGKILQGKEISYNNLLDADQAYKCASELSHFAGTEAVCVIVKHGIPCGVAQHLNPLTALEMAWDADSTSAFGGILCFNQEVTESVATFLKEKFVEVVIAPSFTPEAQKVFSLKKNVRLLAVKLKDAESTEWTMRSINGGILCQDEDQGISTEFKKVTRLPYPDAKLPILNFGLVVTKYLKSNCIGIFSEKNGGLAVITSGVGQPNRLDCITRLIATRLQEKNEDLSEAILVSDAFFPFRDSIEAANEIGIKYIAQPGGSIKDLEVIEACDQFGMAMIMTGKRHFRH
jgi:phosphoribosylaminoimidazolecarboxamide formyltransferase/IMP cyclohydrolase